MQAMQVALAVKRVVDNPVKKSSNSQEMYVKNLLWLPSLSMLQILGGVEFRRSGAKTSNSLLSLESKMRMFYKE